MRTRGRDQTQVCRAAGGCPARGTGLCNLPASPTSTAVSRSFRKKGSRLWVNSFCDLCVAFTTYFVLCVVLPTAAESPYCTGWEMPYSFPGGAAIFRLCTELEPVSVVPSDATQRRRRASASCVMLMVRAQLYRNPFAPKDSFVLNHRFQSGGWVGEGWGRGRGFGAPRSRPSSAGRRKPLGTAFSGRGLCNAHGRRLCC